MQRLMEGAKVDGGCKDWRVQRLEEHCEKGLKERERR